MHITFVKKIKADGSACQKCADVEKRMVDSGYMNRVDEIVIADERDPESIGVQLAARFEVERAPFFMVEDDDENISIYTIYFQFVKEVLQANNSTDKNMA